MSDCERLSPERAVTSVLAKRKRSGETEEMKQNKIEVLRRVFSSVNLNCVICKLRLTDPIGLICPKAKRMYRVCSDCFHSQTLCSLCNENHLLVSVTDEVTSLLVKNLPKITACGIETEDAEHVATCCECLLFSIKQRDMQIGNIKKVRRLPEWTRDQQQQ